MEHFDKLLEHREAILNSTEKEVLEYAFIGDGLIGLASSNVAYTLEDLSLAQKGRLISCLRSNRTLSFFCKNQRLYPQVRSGVNNSTKRRADLLESTLGYIYLNVSKELAYDLTKEIIQFLTESALSNNWYNLGSLKGVSAYKENSTKSYIEEMNDVNIVFPRS